MKNDGGNVITLNRLEVPSNAKFHFSIVAYTFFDIINPFLSETFMQSVSAMPPDFFFNRRNCFNCGCYFSASWRNRQVIYINTWEMPWFLWLVFFFWSRNGEDPVWKLNTK